MGIVLSIIMTTEMMIVKRYLRMCIVIFLSFILAFGEALSLLAFLRALALQSF